MSYLVTEIVQTTSLAKYGARTLAMVLSELAHKDGVAWATIDFDADDPLWKKERSLAYLCNLNERQVRRSLRRLQEIDELETIVAYDGRRRFYVHRLIIGKVRTVPVDYGRGLPRLGGVFWTIDELLEAKEQRPTEGHVAPWIPIRQPDNMSARQDGDDRTSRSTRHDCDDRANATTTGGQIVRRRVDTHVHPHKPLEVQDRSNQPNQGGRAGGNESEEPMAAAAAIVRVDELAAAVGRSL